MKKIIATMIIAALCATSWAYRIDSQMYDFQDEDGNVMGDNGSFAILLGKSGVDFSDFALENGDSFVKGEWFNSDIDTGIYVMDVGSIVDSMAESTIFVNFEDYSSKGFAGGEEIAVIAFDTEASSYTVNVVAGDKYNVFTPSMNGGNTGDTTDPWKLYTAGDAYNFVMMTANQGGTLPDSYARLSQTVSAVPEPSSYAAVFGVLALAFAAYSRRK